GAAGFAFWEGARPSGISGQVLNGRLMNHPLEAMNFPADFFQASSFVAAESRIPLVLEFFDLRLDGAFVEADDFVVFVFDIERLRQSPQEFVFMHGAVALERV